MVLSVINSDIISENKKCIDGKVRMRVPGMVDPDVSLIDLPSRTASDLTGCLQVGKRWKLLLETLENETSKQDYQFRFVKTFNFKYM